MHQLHEVLLLSFPFQAFAVLSAFEEAGLGFGSEAGKKLTFKDMQCENLSNFLFIKVYSGMWIFKVFKRCSYKTSLFTFRFLWGYFFHMAQYVDHKADKTIWQEYSSILCLFCKYIITLTLSNSATTSKAYICP